MGKADNLTQDNLIEEIDFKELSKNCKTEKDLSSLTKQFMKNMIENMLKVNLKSILKLKGIYLKMEHTKRVLEAIAVN